MSNYENKYLKYKKKYIDLKNEQNDLEGGSGLFSWFGSPKNEPKPVSISGSIMFFYDNTNKVVNGIFQDIITEYKEAIDKMNIVNIHEPIVIEKTLDDLEKELNGLLNVFKYILEADNIEPVYTLDLPGMILLDQNKDKSISKRMCVLTEPFNKAINHYNAQSTIKILNTQSQNTQSTNTPPSNTQSSSNGSVNNSDKNNILTMCDKLNKLFEIILREINNKINDTPRIDATKNLLQLVKLYQDLTTPTIFTNIKSFIGNFKTPDENIVSPVNPKLPGTNDDLRITHKNIDLSTIPLAQNKTKKSDEVKVKLENIKKALKTKMDAYNTETTNYNSLDTYVLDIEKLVFNPVTSAIHFKIKKDGKLEVLNIFDINTIGTKK